MARWSAKSAALQGLFDTREFVIQFKRLLGVINRKRRLLAETPHIFVFLLIRRNPWFRLYLARDPGGKPVSTFPDHALES